MKKKLLSRGIRKHIRRKKSKIRKENSGERIKEEINNLYQRFNKNYENK